MAAINVELEVVGPRRGESFDFRHYRFTKGRIKLHGEPDAVMGSARYLMLTQQAYPVGSEELRLASEALHGKPEVVPSPKRRDPEPILSGLPEVPKSPEVAPAVDGGGADVPSPGQAGVRAPGSGQGRAPVAPAVVATPGKAAKPAGK